MTLGLALTSDEVVWVLVDESDGTVVDHDVIEVCSDTEIAGAAARGAHAIAANGGFDIGHIRLTWSQDVARDGLRLRTRLGCLGFDAIEVVPFRCAGAVMVHPDLDPGLALAYGAAFADVDPREALTEPIARPRSVRRRSARARIAVAVLGAAAAAAVAGLLSMSGTGPQVEQTAAAAAQPSRPDSGWVAVPAPSDATAGVVRKVVEAPSPATQETETSTPAPLRAASNVATQPVQSAPEPTPVAVASAAPLDLPAEAGGVPHLPDGIPHLMAMPEAPAPVAATAPESASAEQPHLPGDQLAEGSTPEMTDLANLFTALP